MTSSQSRARSVFLRWFVMALLVGGVAIWSEAQASGGLEGLLRVGEESVVRSLVESELGSVPLTEGFGHDGQFFYAIGIDLSGDIMSEEAGDWAYRYRRILYPLISSALGLLEGDALLWGMVVVTLASFGVACGITAVIAADFGSTEMIALAVLVNPGLWLALRLLTADTLALGLMLFGLYLVARDKRSSPVLFTLSVLAKEVYLPTPAGLAVSRDRRRWLNFLIPFSTLLAWLLFLSVYMTSGFTPRNNLALPFQGIFEALSNWTEMGGADRFYFIIALVTVAAGFASAIIWKGWLRWPTLAWVGLALISSEAVWEFGNNAARVFAPVVALIALAYARHSVGSRPPAPSTVP